jgi:3D (Asp-Asp-Asp) domain-containing protein/peptidoglycan hydrolase CwlO-like protein
LLAGSARADDPDTLRREADRLRAADAALDAAASQALLELYALESELRAAQERADALRAELTRLKDEQDAARRHLELARRAEQEAQDALAARVQALYIEGSPEPLEVILGTASLEGIVDAIDAVDRLSEHDDRIVAQVQQARSDLRTALEELAAREDEVRALARRAEAARGRLAAAHDGKQAYLADLSVERELTRRQIDDLLARAGAAEQRAAAIEADASSPEAEPEPQPVASSPDPVAPTDGGGDVSPEPGRQVVVTSTMYCLTGTTATGIPVAPGVVAVDPAYIPLGTRMYIPGYGEGVAADTGGAVVGWFVDMWVSSCARAAAYGKQTITITLYG